MEKKYIIFDIKDKTYFTYDLNGKYAWVRNFKDGFQMDLEDTGIILPRLNKGVYQIIEVIIVD